MSDALPLPPSPNLEQYKKLANDFQDACSSGDLGAIRDWAPWNSASEQNREFLSALHRRTMREVIEKSWGWHEAWQRNDFERRFRGYHVSIIEREGHAARGLLLEWKPDSAYIHELQVLPDHQGPGIGTAVVEMVIQDAANRGVPVTLSVVPANPRANGCMNGVALR